MAEKNPQVFHIIVTILVGIVLTALIIAIVNVGVSIYLEQPQYDDYCDLYARPVVAPIEKIPNSTACQDDAKVCDDGTVVYRDPNIGCDFPICKEEYDKCNQEYETARAKFNQIRFYIFAVIGLALLISGIFTTSFFQLSGLASGAILIIEGVVVNFQNKSIVFISLLIILLVFGYLSWRILKKVK